MARNDGSDYDGEWPYLDMGRWEVNSRRVLTSKRGQAALRELEQALLALPEPRLIDDMISDGHGVCAIGALAAYKQVQKGKEWGEAIQNLYREYHAPPAHYPPDAEPFKVGLSTTAEVGADECGLTYTLAWVLAEMNDYEFMGKSPEERYTALLAWVRQQLGAS